MLESQGESPAAESRWPDLRRYLTREPVMLALLSIAAILFFLAVSGMSRLYHTQQQSLGDYWSAQGVSDLKERNYTRAVADFRTALRYSRDDYSYQLNLAEALLGQKRANEAYSYLVNLRDRQPDNGLVNLELARIAASRGESELPLRYYHNAIYAPWPGDQNGARQQARLELIEWMLQNGMHTQAQAELIALEANLDGGAATQARVADLFMRAQDYRHALAAYRASLKAAPRHPASLAGAGRAAFHLGHYREARNYLEAAVRAGSHDSEDSTLLEVAGLALRLDPFRHQIPVAEKDRIIIENFRAAGDRLKGCAGPDGAVPADLTAVNFAWQQLNSKVTVRGLRGDPDLAESAMDLVFDIERKTARCTTPGPADRALLLIAKLHEGN